MVPSSSCTRQSNTNCLPSLLSMLRTTAGLPDRCGHASRPATPVLPERIRIFDTSSDRVNRPYDSVTETAGRAQALCSCELRLASSQRLFGLSAFDCMLAMCVIARSVLSAAESDCQGHADRWRTCRAESRPATGSASSSMTAGRPLWRSLHHSDPSQLASGAISHTITGAF